MKKLLLSIFTLISVASFAQKDAQLTLVAPINGKEINSNVPFQVVFTVKNVGSTAITTADSFSVVLAINNTIIRTLVGAAALNPGDSLNLSPQGGGLAIAFDDTQEDDNASFCAVLFFNDTNSADTNSNNFNCRTVKLRQFATAVSEVSALAATVNAYPNPASSVFTITMKSTDATVEVLDITGKLVSSTPVIMGEARMDVSNYNNGVYFYQIKDASNNMVKAGKFTVSH
jgi:hypothetical protein